MFSSLHPLSRPVLIKEASTILTQQSRWVEGDSFKPILQTTQNSHVNSRFKFYYLQKMTFKQKSTLSLMVLVVMAVI